MLKGAPFFIHNWKERFFYVRCLTLELGLPPWGSLRDSVRRVSSLERDDLEASNKLEAYPTPLLSELLMEQLLFNIGLSSLDPAGTIIIVYIYIYILLFLSLILFLSHVDLLLLQTWTQAWLRG